MTTPQFSPEFLKGREAAFDICRRTLVRFQKAGIPASLALPVMVEAAINALVLSELHAATVTGRPFDEPRIRALVNGMYGAAVHHAERIKAQVGKGNDANGPRA